MALEVEYFLEGLTATATDDFDPISGSLYFDAGATDSFTLSIHLPDDSLVEGDESLRVMTRDAASPTESLSVDGTIADNEGILSAQISLAADNTAEGLTVALYGLAAWNSPAINFEFWTEDGTAHDQSDYTATSGTFSLGGGNTSWVPVAGVPTLSDLLIEGTETFKIHVRAVDQPASEVVLEPAIIDLNSGVSFSAGVSGASEGESVWLSLYSWADVTLEYWVVDVSAVNGSDYYGPTNVQSVSLSGMSASIYFSTVEDAGWDPTRSFAVYVRIAGLPESEVVLEADILDDDGISYVAEVTSAIEGGNVRLALTATLPPGVGSATLEYWVSDVSATNSPYSYAGDYGGPSWYPSTVTVYAGSTVYVDFPTYDDAIWEGTESFAIHVRIPGAPEPDLVLEADILENDPPPAGSAWSVAYEYDVYNRLIRRAADEDGDGPAEANPQYFVYDGYQKALELNSLGEVTHRLLWGPAIDQLLADEVVDPVAETSLVFYPLADHQGTIRDLVTYDDQGTPATSDDETTLVEHREYSAFGRVLSDWAVDSAFGFQGRFYDDLTESTEHLNRWLDSWLGQWKNPDPIGFAAGDPNDRRFVGNGPVNAVDPTGLHEGHHYVPTQVQELLHSLFQSAGNPNWKDISARWNYLEHGARLTNAFYTVHA